MATTCDHHRYGRDGALKKLDGLVEQGSLDDSINFMDFLAHDTKMHASKPPKPLGSLASCVLFQCSTQCAFFSVIDRLTRWGLGSGVRTHVES